MSNPRRRRRRPGAGFSVGALSETADDRAARLNQIRLHAVLTSKGVLRYTPAGVPVLEAGLRYAGAVVEAGAERQLDFEIEARAVGEVAPRIQSEPLGSALELTGFLAPRSQRTRKLVFHVTDYAKRGGDGNGSD